MIMAFWPNDRKSYWCHDFTFGGYSAEDGPFSIAGADVPTVLRDEWKPAHCCLTEPGDILVFCQVGDIVHSGIIVSTATDTGTVDEEKSNLESKWGLQPLNTNSWAITAARYGQYRCYSKSPKQGCCNVAGPNELTD
jgi:hypothetical protein